MLYPASWYWGNRRRFVFFLMVAVMLPFALLAWSEPIRELRDCATCPALIEIPAGTCERLERLGGPTHYGGIGMMGREALLSTMPVGSYKSNASRVAAPGIAIGVSLPATAGL
jgi:hypothetical protein